MMNPVVRLLKVSKRHVHLFSSLEDAAQSTWFERNVPINTGGRRFFYAVKPMIPRPLQIILRQAKARLKSKNSLRQDEVFNLGTICQAVTRNGDVTVPIIWFWPDGNQMAHIITHDVETDQGLRQSIRLADIDEKHGYRAVFNLVPEKYRVDDGLISELRARGFEIGVHGLRHDGDMYDSPHVFEAHLVRIKDWADRWGAVGFRSPALLRNALWMEAFTFSWDSSFPDYDAYGPQPGGCRTIYPYFLSDATVELPVTLMQDHTIFEILRHKDIEAWRSKIDYLHRNGGLATIIVHPDYIFRGHRLEKYESYLEHVRRLSLVWCPLPDGVAAWWRLRDRSRIVMGHDGESVIEGPAAGRASIRYLRQGVVSV